MSGTTFELILTRVGADLDRQDPVLSSALDDLRQLEAEYTREKGQLGQMMPKINSGDVPIAAITGGALALAHPSVRLGV